MTAPPHWPSGATCSTRSHPRVRGDEFTPVLAERLAAVSRAGIDAHHLLRAAAAQADLPDDHAAAALWWRISRHLTPAVATSVDDRHTLTPTWTTHLTTVLGTERARDLRDSPFWPALVTAVDHALARGHRLDTLTAMAGLLDPAIDVEPCQALVWRLSVLTDPPPALHDDAGPGVPVDDLAARAAAGRGGRMVATRERHRPGGARPHGPRRTAAPVGVDDDASVDDPDHVHADLLAAALYRESMGVLEPTDAQIERMVARAAAWDHAVADPARLVQINTMAMDFYAANVDAAWAGTYLDDRLPGWRDHPHITAGYAPAGWTGLVDHLRPAASPTTSSSRPAWPPAPAPGTSSTASATGPSSPSPTRTRSSGSSAAATPTSPTTTTPARSTSTPPTPCCSTREPSSTGRSRHCSRPARFPSWSKDPSTPSPSPSPVDGRYVGVAPLGTALTDDQARQLATLSTQPIVATDADLAGRVAAERAYWLLAQHGTDPLAVDLPDGSRPGLSPPRPRPRRTHRTPRQRSRPRTGHDRRAPHQPPPPRRHRGRNPRGRSPTAINVGGSHRRHRRTSRPRYGHRHGAPPHGRHRVEPRPGPRPPRATSAETPTCGPDSRRSTVTPPAGGPRSPTRSTPASPHRATGPLSPTCSRPQTTLVTTSRHSPDDWSPTRRSGRCPPRSFDTGSSPPCRRQLNSHRSLRKTSLWWRPGVPTAANRVPPPLTDTP